MTYEFHSGELELQTRTGVREIASRVAKAIYPIVPAIVEAFLEERRLVVLAAVDAENRPWVSLLAGPAGFVRRLDEHTISIDALPPAGDPLAMNLRKDALAGILIPDLATRRRLRINGRLETVDGAILIHVDQAYSNCPKYIQMREPAGEPAETIPHMVGHSRSLSPHQRDWIRRTDTFFIATLLPGEGADASHRGGMPGFVKVENQDLIWLDYPGNSLFNTLGNIVKYPRAGILVPDFATGSTLQLTGRAVIESNPERSSAETKDELRVRFTPEEVVEMDNVLPQRLRLVEYSPFNPVGTRLS
jgi:predicted pyridoxine 5'-phosphate oxidase superfamily flavin-nucleotide-binding protein